MSERDELSATQVAEMMDQALAGEKPSALATIDSLSRGEKPSN